jgi:hypothetical protein
MIKGGRKKEMIIDPVLKPCPFRGERPRLLEDPVRKHVRKRSERSEWWVERFNKDCAVRPGTSIYSSSDYAISAWNTRKTGTEHAGNTG